ASHVPFPLSICRVTSTQNPDKWTLPTTTECVPWLSSQSDTATDTLWEHDLTQWYRDWQASPGSNLGVVLKPQSANQAFGYFYSSRITTGDSLRPAIKLEYAPATLASGQNFK